MRQNGLRASSFVAVADVDPRIADQLLDLLAFAHVAAYAEPVPGRTGVYRDHHVPARPIDRLWVDRAATASAREVLDRSLPHLQAELEAAIAEGTVPSQLGDAEPAASSATGVGPGAAVASPTGESADAVDSSRGPVAPSVPPVTGVPPVGVPPVGDSVVGDSVVGDVVSAQPPPRPRQPLDQAAVDARWREIVAGWEGPPADEPGPVRTSWRSAPGQPVPGIHDAQGLAPGGTVPDGRDTDGQETRGRDVGGSEPGDGRFGGDRGLARRDDRSSPDSRLGDPPLPGGSTGADDWDGNGPGRRRTDRPDAPVRRSDLPGPRDSPAPPEEEHFTPPAPSPHPPLAATTRVGWAGVIGGPLVLVLVVVFGQYLPRWLPLAGVALLVGGFLVLISRLHRTPAEDDDDDPDDGAVV